MGEETSVVHATHLALSDGDGMGVLSDCMTALLNNALGCYSMALIAAERAHRHAKELGIETLVLPELVEAASRCGQTERAWLALQELSETTRGSVADWGLSMETRSRALLNEGAIAESCYQEAIERLGRTSVEIELGAPICCTASGYVAQTAAPMPAYSCVQRSRYFPRWVPRPSQSAPVVSCWRQARRYASGAMRRAWS